jgi:hypothetical protein
MRPDRLVAPALGALWTQRARLGFAWDVLRHGVCTDCSLGASGLDGGADGTHLCGRRLRRLPRETSAPFTPGVLADIAALRGLSTEALRGLGRLPRPMLRRAGQPGFQPLSWMDATALAAARLRDDRADARWAMLVDPEGLDLETLFQLGRFAVALERRDERRRLDLWIPDPERALRVRARRELGHASSGTSSVDLQPGDPVLLVTDGDQPLLDAFIAPLTRRGVLVQTAGLHDPWPRDARHTLVFGRGGTVAALAAGLPMREAPASTEDLAAVYLIGETAGAGDPGVGRVPVRIHQARHLHPGMLREPAEAVLLLPASPSCDVPGGGTHLCDDLVVRHSPRILGAAASESRPHWEIPVLVAAHADPDLGHLLAAHDASEVRAAAAAARPGLGGLLGLTRAGDSFRLPAPIP